MNPYKGECEKAIAETIAEWSQLRKDNTLLHKVNADLLEALEKIGNIESASDDLTPIKGIVLTAINHAANDMRFGIIEKKEGS